MARLKGARRMVLQAVLDLPKDAAGFVSDNQIAQSTGIALTDAQDWVETLEGEGLVEVARREANLSASLTAEGRLALSQFRSFTATPSNAVNAGNSQRSKRSTRGLAQVKKTGSGDLNVNVKAHTVGSSPRPYGTGELLHLAVDVKLVNLGEAPHSS